jgi:hypothetical protein
MTIWFGFVAPIALVLVATSSCSLVSATATPQHSICAGVSSEMGGCTAERHTYTGSTCAELAVEWAAVVDKAIVAVLDGPDAVDGSRRSARLRQAIGIATVDMMPRMRELGIVQSCDMPEFLAAAEPQFSQRLRSGVGAALFDGDPVMTYQDWVADVKKVVRMIDQNE